MKNPSHAINEESECKGWEEKIGPSLNEWQRHNC